MTDTRKFGHLRCTGWDGAGGFCGAQATWRVTTRLRPGWDYVSDGFLQNYVCDECEPARREQEDPGLVAFEPLDEKTTFGFPIPENRPGKSAVS